MKLFLKALLTAVLLMGASGSFAWWNNNGWGNNYNPYDEWDPRYWAEEMSGGNNGPWNNRYYAPGRYGGGSWNNAPWGGGPWNNRYYGAGPYGGPGYYGGPRYGSGPYGGGPWGY